jgi:hypothetical protein
VRNRELALLTAIALMFPQALGAQQLIVSDSAALDVLATARTLRCSFDSGVGFRYGQAVEPNTLPLLRPQPLPRGAFDNPQIIDQIDRQHGTARLILGAGAVTVEVLSAPPPPPNLRHARPGLGANGVSVSLLWRAGNNPVLITVFANRAPKSMTDLVAVVTRHMEWFGGVDISQYYGRCQVLFS